MSTVSAPAPIGLQVCGATSVNDYEIVLADGQVTLAEVFETLELPAAGTAIDGRVIESPAMTLAATALVPGSRLSHAAAVDTDESDVEVSGHEVVQVDVIGGLDAGASAQLAGGLYRIDPSHGGLGWYIEVDANGRAGASGPWHEHAHSVEIVRDSDFVVACSKPIDSEPGHRRHVHRPPRADSQSGVAPIMLAEAPAPVPTPAPLSWATLLAPIPIALFMAFWFRPLFALFAAMGPVMAAGRWYEARRRYRRGCRQRSVLVARQRAETSAASQRQSEQIAQLRWQAQPHVCELWRRTRAGSVRMWERRPGTAGFLDVMVGIGPAQTSAVVAGAAIDPEVHDGAVDSLLLRPVPHLVSLASNGGVGISGTREDSLAVARSVVLQLASLHGPADMALGVVCTSDATDDWDWLKWLPHRDSGLVATSAGPIAKDANWACLSNDALTKRGNDDEPERLAVIVIDDPSADVALLQRSARLNNVAVRFVAVAASATALPAACSSLIAVSGNSTVIATPEQGSERLSVASVGVSIASATNWARSMKGLSDPELTRVTSASTQEISLLRLLNYPSVEDVAIRWAMRRIESAPLAVLGLGDDGPLTIDLAADGPHVLVAGTTGSGKSEFLRTLVFSLALECPPEQLNFVLVDFKGGGAFDACRLLPHVAGLITDLDEALVERAISSLRAELQRREVLFRNIGVSTYVEAARRSKKSIARLVVVIDEFAALATDYPDMMASVIDLAARGRSLGMHLILATQRPSGVVDQKIRANTNLRIALRVQDTFDSQDVVGVPDAAGLDRTAPGRAIMRIGGDAPLQVQTAYTGGSGQPWSRCGVRELSLFAANATTSANPASAFAARCERDSLVELVLEADEDRARDVRPLWSPPLPTALGWETLRSLRTSSAADSTRLRPGVEIGLVDMPDHQTQLPWRWNPDSGALCLYGASAKCVGNTLTSAGVALSDSDHAHTTHLYVIDGDAGNVAGLASLPNTGAYVTLSEVDRVDRTITRLEQVLTERRVTPADRSPRQVLIIDNVASVLAMHEELAASRLVERLSALIRDGVPHRIHVVLSARTARDVPHRLAQLMANRLVFALADPTGYLTLGLKSREVAALPDMRAIDLSTRRSVHLVEPPDLDAWSSANSTVVDSELASAPALVGSFPTTCSINDVGPARLDDGVLTLPIGIEGRDLDEASLVLQPDEHALVVATNGSGRSTVLLAILDQLVQAALALTVLRVAPRRSPLSDPSLPGTLISSPEQLAQCLTNDRDVVVLVDDARYIDEPLALALRAASEAPDRARIIAATTPEYARSMRSWTTSIKQGGTGMVLGGRPTDGDVLGVRLTAVALLGELPGRGHLVVRGTVQPAQFCGPE